MLKARKTKKILFLVDDASAELLQNIDNRFLKLFTTTRHGNGCTLWLITHSAKKILLPMIRQNLTYVFMYNIESEDLLETIYRDYKSLEYKASNRGFNDFVREFMQNVSNKQYGCCLLARQKGIDWDVKAWALLNEKPIKVAKKPPPKPSMRKMPMFKAANSRT